MWREGGSLNPENRVQLPDGTLVGRLDAGGRDAIAAYLAGQSGLGRAVNQTQNSGSE
jgi:hypothetical protein